MPAAAGSCRSPGPPAVRNCQENAERLGVNSTVRGSVSYQKGVPKFRPQSDLILERATDRDITLTRSDRFTMLL